MKVDLDLLVKGVLESDRTSLGRALTLVESNRIEDRKVVEDLLAHISPKTGEAHRIGITGVPGVGKSTFIEAMGSKLIETGHPRIS